MKEREIVKRERMYISWYNSGTVMYSFGEFLVKNQDANILSETLFAEQGYSMIRMHL